MDMMRFSQHLKWGMKDVLTAQGFRTINAISATTTQFSGAIIEHRSNKTAALTILEHEAIAEEASPAKVLPG